MKYWFNFWHVVLDDPVGKSLALPGFKSRQSHWSQKGGAFSHYECSLVSHSQVKFSRQVLACLLYSRTATDSDRTLTPHWYTIAFHCSEMASLSYWTSGQSKNLKKESKLLTRAFQITFFILILIYRWIRFKKNHLRAICGF